MAVPSVRVTGDAVPVGHEVRITVEVLEQATERSPARLRIRFTNDASNIREFLFESVPPFGPLICHTDTGPLHVLPFGDSGPGANAYDHVIPDAPTDGCWQLATRYTILERGTKWQAPPGETTATNYVILSDPETNPCLPAGDHRFESTWGEKLADGDEVSRSWGLTLSIQE